MTRTRVRGLAWVLLTVGLLVLGSSGGGWWWTNHHATTSAHAAADELEDAWSAKSVAASLPEGAVAVLRIPRLGEDWRMPVYEGTETATLRKGLGLYAGSPAPGADGTYAVAGHRTTWGAPFRKLNTLRKGDEIVVRTAAGTATYRVTDTGVTRPTDLTVIAPTSTPTLTLTTCHPEFSARERLYVHAALED